MHGDHYQPPRMGFNGHCFNGLLGLVCQLLGPTIAIAAPTFTNVAAELGISHVQNATPGIEAMTGGVAAGDFDGDGLVDLFFTRVDAPDVLYRNTGSGFVDVSATAGFTQTLPTNGVASGDIDNDGDLDLYLSASSHERFYLYMNDGAGHFTEQAAARGAAVNVTGATTWRGMGVAFGDYDADGYLDLMTSDHSRPTSNNGSRLLRNLGAVNPGHFEDVTQATGLAVFRTALAVTNPPNAYRFQPQFSDLDQDGRLDIVISADSRTSQLFWNNGDGTFTDGTVAAGVGTDKTGMGTTLGDYDRDGDLDWFVTAIYDTTFAGANPGNRLYRNNGNRTFTDVTTAAGVRNTGPGLSWGWGTTFFDYDNDADLDLIATDGFPAGYSGDRTTLWSNNANATFTDVSVASGIVDTGQGRGLVHLDYDRDGDLDVVIANYGATPIVYRNNSVGDSHWLRVVMEGTVSNRDGIGAFITAIPDSEQSSQRQVQEIGSGGSYLSQSEMAAYFGLGPLTDPLDLVEVYWPASGLRQSYVSVPVDGTLFARERLLGDFNDDGTVDAADYVVWRDSFGQVGEGLAADGAGPTGLPDGVVDVLDLSYWRANFGRNWNPVALVAPLTSVPEPNSIELILLAGSSLLITFACRSASIGLRRAGDHV